MHEAWLDPESINAQSLEIYTDVPYHLASYIRILKVFILQNLRYFKFYGFRIHMNIINELIIITREGGVCPPEIYPEYVCL